MKQPPAHVCPTDTSSRGSCSGRRKRREKMLDASDIRLLMLHFLAQSPAHGYELIKSVEELSKGEYSPSPGIIYPNLTLLEETDAISVVDAQASRKAYSLNKAGSKILAESSEQIASLIQRLSSMAVLVNNRNIPDVEKSIHNLRSALNLRLSQENISQASLDKVIAAMNEAAEKIASS